MQISDIAYVLDMLGRAPELVVEVGSFHGHSALKMVAVLDARGLDSTPLLCIDPWTGDLGELLFRDDWEKTLTPGEITDGRSTAYYQFMLNMKSKIESGEIGAKHIVPLAVTSTVGARYLSALSLTPDIVYLDSAHEKDETFTELSLYYALLADGGVLYGDDFSWEGVKHDVERFAAREHLEVELVGNCWVLRKPPKLGLNV